MGEDEGSEKIRSGRLLGSCRHERDLMLGTDVACMEVQGEPEAMSAEDGARIGRCCMVLQDRRRAIAGCLGRRKSCRKTYLGRMMSPKSEPGVVSDQKNERNTIRQVRKAEEE